MIRNKRRIAVKQAFLIVTAMTLTGLAANWINHRGARLVLRRPVAIADADSFFTALSSRGSKPIGGVMHSPEAIRIINTSQLVRLLGQGGAVVLDARLEQEYQTGHIPSAQSLPFEEFFERREILSKLPRDKWLVCYCEGPSCDKSHLLAQELQTAGFSHVAVYEEGFSAWQLNQEIASAEGTNHE